MKKSDKAQPITISHDFDAFAEYLEKVENDEDAPVSVAQSRAKVRYVNHQGEELMLVHPQSGESISPGYLLAASAEILDCLRAKDLDLRDFSQFQPVVALPGDLLARTTASLNPVDEGTNGDADIPEEILEAGENVGLETSGALVAEAYGFVVLKGTVVTIASPLKVSTDMLRVDWLVAGDHPSGVDRTMLENWLSVAGVKIPAEDRIDEVLELLHAGELYAGAHLLLEGVAPVHGHDGAVEWFVQVDYSAGKLLPDGRIDFRERNYVVNVSNGQLLAKLTQATKGVAGKNVFGRYLPAKNGTQLYLSAGENVSRERLEDTTFFYAQADGAVHVFNEKILVTDVLNLPEGVNFQTGNIDFAGDVIVEGVVKSGFTVKAGGDIVVTEAVENGAYLEAEGNILVGTSISGKRTVVKAGLSVKAQYVNESTVRAGNDIFLGSYARHSRLRSLGTIQVNKSIEEHGGAIIGGEAWATSKIDAHIAGAKAWVQTELIAGILPEQTERLDQLKESIASKNSHIRQILDYFGLSTIDLNKLKRMIEKAEGPMRKGMAIRAKYLAKTGKELQDLLAEKSVLIAEIGPAPDNAEIILRETVFPNVTICIGSARRKQEQVLGPVRLQLKDNALTQV